MDFKKLFEATDVSKKLGEDGIEIYIGEKLVETLSPIEPDKGVSIAPAGFEGPASSHWGVILNAEFVQHRMLIQAKSVVSALIKE